MIGQVRPDLAAESNRRDDLESAREDRPDRDDGKERQGGDVRPGEGRHAAHDAQDAHTRYRY
jgi:hypothetical protein